MLYIQLILLTCMTHEGERDWGKNGYELSERKGDIRDSSVSVTVSE